MKKILTVIITFYRNKTFFNNILSYVLRVSHAEIKKKWRISALWDKYVQLFPVSVFTGQLLVSFVHLEQVPTWVNPEY